jgi:hypothetical protein
MSQLLEHGKWPHRDLDTFFSAEPGAWVNNSLDAVAAFQNRDQFHGASGSESSTINRAKPSSPPCLDKLWLVDVEAHLRSQGRKTMQIQNGVNRHCLLLAHLS